MKYLRLIPWLVVSLVMATFVWVIFSRVTGQAKWLEVEVPSPVVIGRVLPVSIVLKAGRPDEFLRFDLHWKDRRGVSRGLLSSGQPVRVRADVSVYRYYLPVPAHSELGQVYGVIYLSPTGLWAERTRVCTLDLDMVGPAMAPAGAGRSRRVAAYDQSLGPPLKRQDSRAVRWLTAVLWLTAGVAVWRVAGISRSDPPGPDGSTAARWVWFAVACLLALAWEATAAEGPVGDYLRRMAMAHGWYTGRRHVQEVLTLAVVAASLVFALVALRRDHARPVSWVFSGIDAYGGVSAVSFISLHDADAWLAVPVLTIPTGQILKLAAALLAVGGALGAVWAADRRVADGAGAQSGRGSSVG